MGSNIRSKTRRNSRRNYFEALESKHMLSGFHAGDLVVYRVGDGTTTLSGSSTAVFLDEYKTDGTLVQSIAMPTAAVGSNGALTASGTSVSEGSLNLTVNGQYLTLGGYNAAPGVASIAGTNSTSTARVVGIVGADGSVNTTTELSDWASGGNPRSVISTDGTSLWVGGTPGGVRYTTAGSATSTQLSTTTTNIRTVGIYNGQLYISSQSGSMRLGAVGTGEPTASGANITNLSGFETSTGSPYAFYFAHLASTGSGADTLYVADDSAGQIQKWSFDGTTWTQKGSIAAASVRGLTGTVSGSTVTLYGTTGGNGTAGTSAIYVATDSTGYGATVSGTATTLLTGATNEAFRGIAFAPQTPAAVTNTAITAVTPTTANFGDPISFTATVTAASGSAAPTGTVSFMSNSTLLATTSVASNNGTTATFTVSSSTILAGTWSNITAVYNPSGNFVTSTSAAYGSSLTINPSSTVVTLTDNGPSPSLHGQAVSFGINCGTGTTGTINLEDQNNGNAIVGSGTLSNGSVNISVSNLGVGFHNLFAVYSGDSNHAASSSSLVGHTVNDVPALAFDSATYSVNEAGGNVTITVDRTNDLTDALNVTYFTTDGTAHSPANYTGTNSGTFTIAGGSANGTFTVPVNYVANMGGNKNFTITLNSAVITGGANNGVAGTVSATPTTVTILDNSETIGLSTTSYTVNDTAGTAVFSVVRTGYAGDQASVSFTTSKGDSGSATFTPNANGTNAAVATFSVPIADVTGNQSFTIHLSSPSGNLSTISMGTADATATIVDAGAITNNLTATNTNGVGAQYVTDVETGSTYATTYAPVVGDTQAGTGSFGYLALEVMEFSKTLTPSMYPAAGYTVDALNSLSLQLYNSATTGNYGGHVGNFNVYFIPDTDSQTPTSGMRFQTADPTGLNGQGSTSSATLLGTFSFNNNNGGTAGYDTYTAASIPAGVVTQLEAALNNGASFRLAITPETAGVGAIAADWVGPLATKSPVLSMDTHQTQHFTGETLNFDNATYSVDRINSNTVELTITRSDITDSASVHWATSNGTAIAGQDYTANSGNATFAQGHGTATIDITVASNLGVYGNNKAFNVTLDSPDDATGHGYVHVLGTPSTAVVNIMDSRTIDLTQNADQDVTIRVAGPYSNASYLNVEPGTPANITSGYAAFGVMEFNNPSGTNANHVFANPGYTIGNINSIILNTMTGGPSIASWQASGTINVYLVEDTSVSMDPSFSPMTFNQDGTDPTEGLGNQLGAKHLLGTMAYSSSQPLAVYTSFQLTSFDLATKAKLIDDLNNNKTFRLVMTSGDGVAAASFEGDFTTAAPASVLESPQLIFNVMPQAADTTPPVVSISAPTGTINTATPTISGIAGVASGDASTVTVNVYAGSTATGTPVQVLSAVPVTPVTGAYSIATGALTNGTYTVQAVQTDASSNVGTSNTLTFTVDTVAPVLSISSPVALSTTYSSTPTISGTAGILAGDASTVTVNVYAGGTATGTPVQVLTSVAVTPGTGAYSVATNALTDGTYTVQAVQSDAAGNVGTSTAVTFAKATAVAPTVASTQVGDGTTQRSAISSFKVTFNAAVNIGSNWFTINQYANGNTGGTATDVTSGFSASSSDGGTTWTFTVIDNGMADRSTATGHNLLKDGVYQVILHGNVIADAASGTVKLNGGADKVAQFTSNVGGAHQSSYFHSLFGDYNGIGKVNNASFARFNAAFGSSGVYNSLFDFDGGGAVNNSDFARFNANFGKTWTY